MSLARDGGDDKFGLKGDHHAFLEAVARLGRYHRPFVELYADAVAYESGLLAVAHEILGQAVVAGYLDRLLIHLRYGITGDAYMLELAKYMAGHLMGVISELWQIAYSVCAREV